MPSKQAVSRQTESLVPTFESSAPHLLGDQSSVGDVFALFQRLVNGYRVENNCLVKGGHKFVDLRVNEGSLIKTHLSSLAWISYLHA